MPRADFKIKRHDTIPDFVVDLTAGGAPADLNGALTATFHLRRGSVAKVNHVGSIEDQTAHPGRVKYVWQEGDTDTKGLYKAEFELDFGNGLIQTYPNDGYLYVQIVEDLA